MHDPFNGTLFRFPLRTAQQASVSKLKNDPCTRADVEGMLASFIRDGSELLLHLNHVQAFELFIWEVGAEKPSLVWKVESQKEAYTQIPNANQHMVHCGHLQMDFHYNHILMFSFCFSFLFSFCVFSPLM